MRKLLLIVLLVSCHLSAQRIESLGQTSSSKTKSSDRPKGWVLYRDPSDADLRCANYSEREWEVSLKAENLQIRLDTDRDHQDPLPPEITSRDVAAGSKTERHVIRVSDGWLIGLNRGEFGGGLWWFSSDGKRSKRISGEPVVGFADSSKGVLSLVGLAHLFSDSGRVLRISDGKDGNRTIEMAADLGSAPRTFVVESPESILVITTHGLARVQTSGKVERLFTARYGLLYPNSMALSASGVIYVGMRHFVTRLTPTGNGYKEEWFVPTDCSRFRIRTSNLSCVCVSGKQ